MARAGLLLFPVLVVCSAPALADETNVNVPGGALEDVALELARQTGSSIVIADRDLARRPVGPIRGRYSTGEAVEALARAAGARPVRAGRNGWRLVPAPIRMARRKLAPAPSSPPPLPPAPPPEAAPGPPIVVVGSKRDVPLRDYPGQVSQIDGQELTFGGVGGTERIVSRVAAVSTTHLGSGRNKLFIRGIADSSFTGPTQSTVGQYLGDLRLSYNSPDPDLRLSDLASVEVLEGPQGTLYGSGSLGGIVRLVPNTPKLDRLEASAMLGGSATMHGRPGGDAGAVLNLPLAEDRLGLRLTAAGEVQGGYIDKPLDDRSNVNRTRIGSVRGSLRLALDPDWTVDLIGVLQATRGDDSQYADRAGPPLQRSSRAVEGYSADYDQSQVVLSGRIGDIRLRSSTGIAHQELSERYDATLPGEPERLFVQRNRMRMFANETRAWVPLGEHTGWLLGSSFTRNRTRLRRELGAPGQPMPATGVTNRIEEFTLYGEASLRLAQGLTATLGGRWTTSTISGQGEDVLFQTAFAGRAVTSDRTERMLLPSAALTAQPLPDTTLYLRYQQGFRPGGLAIEGDFVRRFRNDRIATFEVGARHGQPRQGRFDLAASVSYTDWDRIQADYIDINGLPTTANVGDGRIWTFSFGGGYSPSRDLRFDMGLVYNRSRITQPNLYRALTGAALAPITEVPNVAEFSARFGFDYRREIGSGMELKALGWARYVGRSRLGVGPELGDLQGNYLDTGLTVRLGRERLGATLGITNLTDSVGNRFALGTPFAVGREQVTPLRPLTIRLGLDAAF
jgi:iron complex outermembrane recepter protein